MLHLWILCHMTQGHVTSSSSVRGLLCTAKPMLHCLSESVIIFSIEKKFLLEYQGKWEREIKELYFVLLSSLSIFIDHVLTFYCLCSMPFFFRCQCVLIYRYFFNDNSAKTYTSRTAVFNRSVLFYMYDKILVTRSSIKVFFIYITKFKQVEYCLNKFWKSK